MVETKFPGLDNTDTVSEMQLCINIRIVMWVVGWTGVSIWSVNKVYIYIFGLYEGIFVDVGQGWGNENVSAMLACVIAMNQPIV